MDATKILLVDDEADFEPPIMGRLKNIETIDREARVRNWRRKADEACAAIKLHVQPSFRTIACLRPSRTRASAPSSPAPPRTEPRGASKPGGDHGEICSSCRIERAQAAPEFEGVEMEGNDDARMVGCNGAASALKGARMHGVNFSGASGLNDVVVEQIDIGPEGALAILTGEAAFAWLLRRTALPPE